MKRYITFVLVAMSLVGLVACSNDNGIAAPDGEAQVALRFESSSMTRADEVAGSDALNENLIKTIDCYFYSANADEYDDAVWYQKFTFGTDGAGINSSATVTDILMPSGEMNAIFGTGTTGMGKIYAIANYAGGNALPTSGANTTVAKLKDMVVTTAWLDASSKFQTQSSFVMDSEMVEITKSEGNTISGTVPLFRTAAKVELTITGVAESAKDAEGNVWVPNITVDNNGVVTGANVTMYNARTTSSVGGAVQAFEDGTHPELTGYGFSAGNLYKQTNPFYTYPHAWTSSEQEAYLLLVVNWKKKSDNSTTANCYYEIPIGAADNKAISRNHIYQIGINVGTLGSFVKEDPKLLTPSYMVVDWGTGNISAKIKGQRYLVVDKHSYTMENTTTLNIPFVTSHECEIVEYDCTQEFLFDSDTNPTEGPDFDENADGTTNRKYSINIVGNNIVVKHGLNNDLYDSTGPDEGNGVFDFTPYTITFTIRHKDATTTFKQAITITQNPAMYGQLQINSGSNNKGYTYVNGYVGSTSNAKAEAFCAVAGAPSGSGVNSDAMIIITSSNLQGTGYISGDPRTTEVDQTLIDKYDWLDSPALYNGTSNRELMYYYPAQRDLSMGDQHPTYNMIAPKFRICSGYGAINNNMDRRQYIEYMEGRCASYQEDGYPAGRWRLPTKAELEYINTLCEQGLLPDLFADIPYWTAHGYGRYNTDTGKVEMVHSGNRGSTSVSVRCVYDDWYWGSEPALTNKGTFTWGDMPRNN